MERCCDACDQTYLAKRATSRYCSERCRKRALRARAAGPVVDLGAPKKRKSRDRKPRLDQPTELAVAAATRTHLTGAGRMETPLGQAALVLAGRIDACRDTGSALASLTKEWRQTMAAATAGVKQADNPLDELRARREARRRGA